ncbi:ATP-binding protein, partial [Desulfobacterales bacterium HSG17]|nr:ATP-binding protein [Desulfobacterales bacterium HSG17]
MRYFNTAGPVNCKDHYCLDPLSRFDLEEVLQLIDQGKYFVLHAPRQTGKTSSLHALMKLLNKQGKYTCLYINVEMAQAARENIDEGIRYILSETASRARDFINEPYLESIWYDLFQQRGAAAFNEILTLWSLRNEKPLVLLIDEIDSLVGDTLISVLRQLRAGYDKRPAKFPQSIILCGVRDVRDYRIHSDQEKKIITGGSAFNIKAESLRLGDFSKNEVEILYQIHTDETGQKFEPDAINAVWELSEGQPWLVNALAYEVCFKMKPNRDRSVTITHEMIHQARENLILRRETHIDQLTDKLLEDRVINVIEPMLRGINLDSKIPQDDIQYVMDLGLIKRGRLGFRLSNAIYMEIIPREIAFVPQLNFESNYDPLWYI